MNGIIGCFALLAAGIAGNLAAEDICCLDTAESFAISAENPTGVREAEGPSMIEPDRGNCI